jgi:hypothetical protein
VQAPTEFWLGGSMVSNGWLTNAIFNVRPLNEEISTPLMQKSGDRSR